MFWNESVDRVRWPSHTPGNFLVIKSLNVGIHVDFFSTGDAILNRDALWFIQGNKLDLKVVIVVR